MRLYITPGSPYARIVRMLIIEKGLTDRVEIVNAQTRQAGSPYYAINPSGRVPYLVRDDGVGFEESALICAWLDRLDGAPCFEPPADAEARWQALRLEALARSTIDGLAVWIRELRRPENERSPTILRHEADRAARMAAFWEREIRHPWMQGEINMAQMTLASALAIEARCPGFDWRSGHPELVAWYARISARPCMRDTQAPAHG
jgi:glutathione S-transferase